MTNSITPPPELVEQWLDTLFEQGGLGIDAHKLSMGLAARAAQWGADRELEACCEWFICDRTDIETADNLRAARRPKPPSLKRRACDALDAYIYGNPDHGDKQDAYNTIRRALEALPDD